jgi:hypothetical protein
MNTPIRTVIFEPYVNGEKPFFVLNIYNAHKQGEYGKRVLSYKLSMTISGRVSEDVIRSPETITLFEGEDYQTHHKDNSPELIEDLMGFLTLRPGDTDDEWFKDYTKEQLDYCDKYAEALACEVNVRFGDH